MRKLVALSRVARLACMAMGVSASPVIAQPSGGLAPIPGCDIKVARHLVRGSLEYIDAETELGSGLTTRTLRWRRCGLRRGRLRRGGRIGLRYA